MVPIDSVHDGYVPQRLLLEEIVADGNGGLFSGDTRAIILCYEFVGYGEGRRRGWRWCCCRANVPEGVSFNAEVSDMIVTPFV